MAFATTRTIVISEQISSGDVPVAPQPNQPKQNVAVIVLNWNAWGDCIECLESVYRSDHRELTVFLCDNRSTDGSRDHIFDWAAGQLCARAESPAMTEFSCPPCRKPITVFTSDDSLPQPGTRDLIWVQTGANLGFAAGHNAGIELAMSQAYDFLWILNADTVVDSRALSALLARAASDPDIGLCGSVLCYYDAPETIQEAGGCAYYPYLGIARRLAPDAELRMKHDWRALEGKLGYVSAASCLASRAFVKDIGLLSEDYFLYCEEIDWATRARGRFTFALAEDSLVYHKKGRSTGSKSVAGKRSPMSAYYLWRARRRFTKRFYPLGLPSVFALAVGAALVAFITGQKETARATLRGVMNKSNE
ncbi:MAG: glycosyltransferase family 2 protein [Silicimonas sp.]|nr:glycosyltransferase family 2 protein [Silicimonas sp.]